LVGAPVDYWLGAAGGAVKLTVQDASGTTVQELKPAVARGVNRADWNLRYADIPLRGGGGEDDDEGPRATSPGPLVMPGTYTVKLEAGGVTSTQRVVVRDDPRLTVSPADRRSWTDFQRQVAALAVSFAPVADRARRATATDAATVDNKRQASELLARIGGLYSASARWTGRPTADQRSRLAYYQEMARKLGGVSF
jgi:hypothetical protein